MTEDPRGLGDSRDADYGDPHYYGPFGQQTEVLYPIPPAEPYVQPAPYAPPELFPAKPRRPLRAPAVIGIAALTALLVGTAAGVGSALLVDRNQTAEVPSSRSTPISAPQSPLPPAPPRANTVEVAKLVLPSSVTIRVQGASADGGATGSGFVLDKEGRVMTNNHVVAEAADGGKIQVIFSDGRRAAAEVLGRSPSYDLAVIKVEASPDLVPIQIGDSAATQVGDPAIAVGSPLGLGGTVTEGIISAKDRPVVVGGSGGTDQPQAFLNAIQTDAPINPGNSGGPLVDAGGRVIGVNSAILTMGESQGENGNIGLGFAIPINQAMQIGQMLITDGKATYPVIGATVSDESTENGVRLVSLEPGGPAEKAGLKQDDVVVEIDGLPVRQTKELIVTVRTHRPGDVVKLKYERDGQPAEAQVTLGSKEG